MGGDKIEKIRIKFTKHDEIKIEQREIAIETVEKVVEYPDRVEPDRFDSSLAHFIKLIDGRFLRVIAKRESEEALLVISAFFDRRLKKEEE